MGHILAYYHNVLSRMTMTSPSRILTFARLFHELG